MGLWVLVSVVGLWVLFIRTYPNVSNSGERRKKKKPSRGDFVSKSSDNQIFSRQKKKEDEELYPSARGLLGVTPKRTGF